MIGAQVPAAALFQSGNVTVLGTLAEGVGAIGARFSPDGNTMRRRAHGQGPARGMHHRGNGETRQASR